MPWFIKKTLHHRCLTGFWIFLRFWIYQDSKYARVTQDSWKMLLIDAWQDSEYSSGSKYGRVLNMSGLHKVLNKTHYYTISFIMFWDFSMFYQIFLSPQVKRCAIITYKHGIFKLPHEFYNSLCPVTDSKIADSSKNSGNPVYKHSEQSQRYWA